LTDEASSKSLESSPRRAHRARRRRASARSQTARETGGSAPLTVLLALTVGLSVLAVGSVHVEVLLVVCPLGIAAGVLALSRPSLHPLPVVWPALIAAALSGYCVLQALPLPVGLARLVSPQNTEIWQGALNLFEPGHGESRHWVSVSLDPGATWVEALKWACYASVFIAGARLAAERGLTRVAEIVFGASLLVTLVTLAHRLLRAETLFGLYRPVFASPSFGIAPLLNPNNLAGYLNLGAFVGLGLLATRKPDASRSLFGIAIASIVGLSAVCGSRAGFACLLIGSVCVLATSWFGRASRGRQAGWTLGLLGASLALGFALFAFGASVDIRTQLFEESTKKIELFRWTRPLLAHHPWLGIGRGSFETVFPAYRMDVGNHLYQFAENFVMQWCAEWGIPVALLALLGFAIALRPRSLGVGRGPLERCVAIGVACLLLQNLLDLALELASVSIALFTVLGGLWGAKAALVRGRRGEGPSFAYSSKAAPLLLGSFGAALTLVAGVRGFATPIRDRAELAEMGRRADQGDARAKFELPARLEAAIRRHPADAYLALLGAGVFAEHGVANLDWVARAIDRDGMAGQPHLLLARAFAVHGKIDQALLAIRMAAERDQTTVPAGIKIALKLGKDFDGLAPAIPVGKDGALFLSLLAAEPTLQARRVELLEEATARAPDFVRPRSMLAQYLLESLEQNREPCSKTASDCLRRLAGLSAEIGRIEPGSSTSLVFAARALLVQGKAAEAERLLSERCSSLADWTGCSRWRVLAAAKLPSTDALHEAAAALLAASCSTAESCAEGATWLAGKYMEVHDPASALKMYERAARETGSPEAWRRVAESSKQLGLNSVAERALKRAGDPKDSTATQELEKARLIDGLESNSRP